METPPPSPGVEPSPVDLTREQALGKVKPPAIALIVVAGIGIAFTVLMLAVNVLGLTVGTMEAVDDAEAWANIIGGGAGVLSGVVGILIGVLIIFGAMKMMQLQTWGLALTAAIVAMVPCVSPCCLLGLPFGIWAIVVLADSNVKAHFT